MPTSLLRFPSPDVNNIVKLHVYESALPDGPFVEVDSTTTVGTYPTYINEYEAIVNSLTDWFSIAWEDGDGEFSELSSPIKGRRTSVLNALVERVMQRDPIVEENVVVQESEAVLWRIFGSVTPDAADVTPLQLSGMTYLVLARIYMGQLITSAQDESYTAGLVQQKSSTGTAIKANIEQLISLANADLGLNLSVVMLMSDIWPLTSVSSIENDESRLALTVYRQ